MPSRRIDQAAVGAPATAEKEPVSAARTRTSSAPSKSIDFPEKRKDHAKRTGIIPVRQSCIRGALRIGVALRHVWRRQAICDRSEDAARCDYLAKHKSLEKKSGIIPLRQKDYLR